MLKWKLAQKEKALWSKLAGRGLIKLKKLNGSISITQISRLISATNITKALNLPLEILEQRLKNSKELYIQSCRNAPALQDEFQESLDDLMAK